MRGERSQCFELLCVNMNLDVFQIISEKDVPSSLFSNKNVFLKDR